MTAFLGGFACGAHAESLGYANGSLDDAMITTVHDPVPHVGSTDRVTVQDERLDENLVERVALLLKLEHLEVLIFRRVVDDVAVALDQVRVARVVGAEPVEAVELQTCNPLSNGEKVLGRDYVVAVIRFDLTAIDGGRARLFGIGDDDWEAKRLVRMRPQRSCIKQYNVKDLPSAFVLSVF